MASSRKRFLFLLPNSDEFGGVERHLLQLVDRLLLRDVDALIVTFGKDVISDRLDPAWGARVQVRARKEPAALWGWIALFRQIRPHTVVFCYGWILSFPWQAVVAARLSGIRKRYAIQHLVLPPIASPYPGRGLYGALRRRFGERARQLAGWRLAGRLCTRTICVSDAVRNALLATLGFSPGRTTTIRNGVSTSAFTPCRAKGDPVRRRLGIADDTFVLVCTARLSKVKGIGVLLQALSLSLGQGVDLRCIVLGDGPLRDSLLSEAVSLGVLDRVYFEGFQSDVEPYLQAASAFILTSTTEGLPLSILEAMACGLPCIATDVGGSAEAVENGVTGMMIAPGSADEAARAILYMATHAEERGRMAIKARERVCEHFNADLQMNQLVEVVLN